MIEGLISRRRGRQVTIKVAHVRQMLDEGMMHVVGQPPLGLMMGGMGIGRGHKGRGHVDAAL